MAQWLSRADLASAYGVSIDTIRRWEKSGRITGVRFGPRCVRFNADAVHAELVGA